MKKIIALAVLVALFGVNAAFAHPRNLQRVEQRLEQRRDRIEQRIEAVQQRIETRRANNPCPRT